MKTPFMRTIDRTLAEDPLFAADVEMLIDRVNMEQDVLARVEQLLSPDPGSPGRPSALPELPRFARGRTRS